MLAGKYHKMEVLRPTTLGYVVTMDGEEYFLHQAETKDNLEIGQKINAFLYYDSKKRLTATLDEAKISTDQYGWVEVVSTRDNLGVFVDIGINKEILVAPSELPIFESL